MAEIELKFLVDERAAKRLWRRAREAGIIAAGPARKSLRSIYFDTPEHALKKAGIALRLRRDGRRWLQTAKAGRALHGGLSQATESECAAPGGRIDVNAIPDAALRDQVARCVDGDGLQPVCETLMKRTLAELALEDGTRAELAVDFGEIRAGERSATLHEAEIELLSGSPGRLFDIARTLFPDGGLRFSRLSKSARGYLLAEAGIIEPPLAPRNALAIALVPDETAETAARDVLRECVDQIAANVVATAALDDPEGAHQLRVGLRRLRSAFSVFRPLLHGPDLVRINDEARWLAAEVGALRDLDVAAEIARLEAQAHADEPPLAVLGEALGSAAAARRKSLRALLEDSRTQMFVLDLVRFVEMRGWLAPDDLSQTARLAVPVASLAGEALDKCWKKVRKRAHDIDDLDVPARHELRKRLKKLRYAVEFFAPLYPDKRVQKFVRRLKALQTVFGDLNDAALVRSILSADDAPLAGTAGGQRAIGWLIGATQAHAAVGWPDARALWKQLKASKPFWR